MIGLVDKFDARVFFGVGFGNGGGVVGGTVVDEDDFKILISLGEDGIEAGGEVFCSIIDGDDDGNERFSFGHVTPLISWLGCFCRRRSDRRKGN